MFALACVFVGFTVTFWILMARDLRPGCDRCGSPLEHAGLCGHCHGYFDAMNHENIP